MGQHYGLATPLLDWTESPYVAVYFAFAEMPLSSGGTLPHRVVFALDREEVRKKNEEILAHGGRSGFDTVEVFSPLTTENPRLVSQRALFSRLPVGQDVEGWVQRNFQGEDSMIVFLKILIPEQSGDRDRFIRLLNRMNVNPLTLFPDLMGASLHCNNDIVIQNY